MTTNHVNRFQARVETLRGMLRRGEEFREPFKLFHDEIANDPAFHDACQAVERPVIVRALQAAAERALGAPQPYDQTVLFHLTGTDFLHGAALGPAGITAAFYFENDEQGLVGVPRPDGNMCYVRFTLVDVDPAAPH